MPGDKTQPNTKRLQRVRELTLLAGCAAAIAGIAAFDWRVALIIAGVALAAASLYGMKRG